MKIRKCFVSNSSSSSFIIKDKDNIEKVKEIINNHHGYDYYMYKDELYTSFISDGSDIYEEIDILSDEDIEGGHSCPYDEENFVEVEGDLGIDSVYILKEKLDWKDLVDLGKGDLPSISKRICNMVSDFIDGKSDLTKEELLKSVCAIINKNNVGYLQDMEQQIERDYRLLINAHDTIEAILSHPDMPDSEGIGKLVDEYIVKDQAIKSEYDIEDEEDEV